MKIKMVFILATGFLAMALVPATASAQGDAYNCVNVQWKAAYNADFIYDTCSQAITVVFATPGKSGEVASEPQEPAIVYERPGSPYKYWACTGGAQPLDNRTQLAPTYNSTDVSCK